MSGVCPTPSEMHLELFHLAIVQQKLYASGGSPRTGVVTGGSAPSPATSKLKRFFSGACSHWAIRIGDQRYELVNQDNKGDCPRAFRFGPSKLPEQSEPFQIILIGRTHHNKDKLEDIAKEIEQVENEKSYIWESWKGYILPFNNCQTAATKFWKAAKCSDASHDHPKAPLPMTIRQAFLTGTMGAEVLVSHLEDIKVDKIEAQYTGLKIFVSSVFSVVHAQGLLDITEGWHSSLMEAWHSIQKNVASLVVSAAHADGLLDWLMHAPQLHVESNPYLGTVMKACQGLWELIPGHEHLVMVQYIPLSEVHTVDAFLFAVETLVLSIPTWISAGFWTFSLAWKSYRRIRWGWRIGMMLLTGGELLEVISVRELVWQLRALLQEPNQGPPSGLGGRDQEPES